MTGSGSSEAAAHPLGKFLAEHSAMSGQVALPQSGIIGFSWGQHGMSAETVIADRDGSEIDAYDTIVTVSAAIAPTPVGAAIGARIIPRIARIGRSRSSQSGIIVS
jgi:hypothetical protein